MASIELHDHIISQTDDFGSISNIESSTKEKQRIKWIDQLRGLGIFFGCY